ncbi:MAG TPA: branched-chain amino acid ABC transporter permease [Stellaceae bacterium]|jgi:branched-chain amino acid transport system permease protein|nr:branched-chain amino acid ABC transporter permease [Stellaceae bacterium]
MAAPATPQGAALPPAAGARWPAEWRGALYGIVLIAVVAALPALPFMNNYLLAVTVRALIFIALGQAWNVVAGIGGLLSLGHGVFLGLGCYATGILFNQYGLPPWLGVWVGVLLSLAVALVMGSMTLRMRGVFFALATIAVSLAFDQLARHYVDLTGGDNGLALKFLGNSLWFMQSRTPAPFLYAGLVFVTAYYWITRWILGSRFGLEMRAVRDDEVAAAAAGVAVFRTKLLGLLLSAAMTSVAGTFYMQFYQAIDPETAFGLSQAIQLQLPALIGGLGTSFGPIVGGAVMIVLSESTNWGSSKLGIAGVDILVYGLLLLAVVMYAPKGIMGLFPARRGQ